MKIGFSSQMREMPKHTANMTAVTSRAHQQYSVVDMFLQLTRFSGFSRANSQLSAPPQSTFAPYAYTYIYVYVCKPCFFFP